MKVTILCEPCRLVRAHQGNVGPGIRHVAPDTIGSGDADADLFGLRVISDKHIRAGIFAGCAVVLEYTSDYKLGRNGQVQRIVSGPPGSSAVVNVYQGLVIDDAATIIQGVGGLRHSNAD
ncbi:hypothetical protein ABC383_15265 [Noviherbaspirillum sp. 1P10PC]|uniref:hypothetical protein n=1 Tax=Noviherbaspirillum sp. 1P10PC TaxID=3132292 RepID=UPI0039A089D1